MDAVTIPMDMARRILRGGGSMNNNDLFEFRDIVVNARNPPEQDDTQIDNAPPLTDRLRDGFLPIILSWMGCDQESAEDFADELLAVVTKETT